MMWRGFASLFARSGAARVGRLGHAHVERLSAIHASAFARPWTAEDFDGFLAERAIRADGLFLGRDSQPTGFALTRVVGAEAEILSVAMARGARGRGHARALLLVHIAGLAQARVGEVHLEVEEGNDPAIALYRGLGFEPVGRRVGYYLKPDGSRASAITMRRRLADA